MDQPNKLKGFIDPPQHKLDYVNYDVETDPATVTVFKPLASYVGFQMPIATNLNNSTVYIHVTPSFSDDLVKSSVEFCLYGIMKGRRGRDAPVLTMIPGSKEDLDNNVMHTIALNLYKYRGAKHIVAVVCANASKMSEQSYLSVNMNQISLEDGLLDTMKASGQFVLAESNGDTA